MLKKDKVRRLSGKKQAGFPARFKSVINRNDRAFVFGADPVLNRF